MNPLGIALTVAFAGVVFFFPRRFAALGVVAAVCYITQGQQVNMLGFHFTAIRWVLLAGVVRGALRGELKTIRFNRIDWCVLSYPLIILTIATLRVQSTDILVYEAGCSYDIMLSYLVFRILVCDVHSLEVLVPWLGILIAPFAGIMMIEAVSGKNIFQPFGGIAYTSPIIREGQYRCEGSFRVPITAGVFGATLVPLFLGAWFANRRRGATTIGLLSATIITYTSNSSGPLMAFLSGLVGCLFWPARERMRTVRWAIVATLVVLHLMMKPPVWYLFSKLSDITGGDGWYRSYLIDQTIRYFPSWYLIGASDTSEWMPTAVTTQTEKFADITNQYISAGVNGGLLAMVVFIAIPVRCFQSLGAATRVLRQAAEEQEKLLWGLGCALFAHVVTLFSVTYFDQMHVAWWGLLGIIASVTFANQAEAVPNECAASEDWDTIPSYQR